MNIYIFNKIYVCMYCCTLQGKRSIRHILAYANVFNNLVKKELYVYSMGYIYMEEYIYIIIYLFAMGEMPFHIYMRKAFIGGG